MKDVQARLVLDFEISQSASARWKRVEASFFSMSERCQKRLLLLTVGYGEGHNSAAHAISQAAKRRGWQALVADPCFLSSPRLFAVTQAFYRFCVRSAPWIWGITYAQTETADWSTKSHAPVLSKVTRSIRKLIDEYRPDAILCTYPLFAYMLDTLRAEQGIRIPYGVVVTDSLEISRPWMLSAADMFYLPDNYSVDLVKDRFALPDSKLLAAGFAVKAPFLSRDSLAYSPSAADVRIVYGAYAPKRRVRADVRALCHAFPGAHITVIAGARYKDLIRLQSNRVKVIARTDDMVSLFENAHIYIGKAGAATVFEAYAMNLPLIINYALPGQEQGNAVLVQLDGVGRVVETTPDLIHLMSMLLADNAAMWCSWKHEMKNADRKGGADTIMADIENRFLYESML